MTQAPIFKLVSRQLWREAQAKGIFKGASIDLVDGYIHFSTAEQLAVTARKHFSGQADLLLLEVDASDLGDLLRWEPSRGGDLFPHLYAPLALEAVRAERALAVQDDGQMVFQDSV